MLHSVRFTVRARWDRGRVTFANAADFEQEFASFISRGAVLVAGADLPSPLEPFDFAIEPPGGAPVRLRGMIVSTTPAGALIQIMDFSAALVTGLKAARTPPAPAPGQAVLLTPIQPIQPVQAPRPAAISPLYAARAAALGQSPMAPDAVPAASDFARESSSVGHPATGVFPMTAPPTLSGPLRGEVSNPVTLAELRNLPLGPIAAIRSLERVSTAGLVRFLGARRATGWLTVRQSSDGAERRWAMEKGSFLLASHEREAARAAFQFAAGTFSFEPAVPDRPASRTPVLAWRLVLDAVRARLREATLDELKALIDVSRAATLGAAYLERSRALELTPQEERVLKRDFDGRQCLREVARIGALSEVALLRLVYLLDIMGLVEYGPPQGDSSGTDDVRAHYERIVHEDLFSALGLHWSDPPERLPEALENVRRRFGPGSPSADSSPEYAAKVMELAERAYRRLEHRGERRRYRQELNLHVRHAAELLMQQVPLASARGEMRHAYELASAACDLFDNPLWERTRRDLAPQR